LPETRESLVRQYAQTKDPELREKLVLLYKSLVDHISRKLAYNIDDLDDVVQVGHLGLLRALDHFDPSYKADFSTFAIPNIVGEIRHYFRDKRHVVKIPRKLQETNSKIKKYLKEHQQDPIQPTIAIIAKELELTEEEVLEAMEAGRSFSVVSLDTPTYSDGDSKSSQGTSETLVDSLGGDHQEDTYINRVTLQGVMETLSEREREIIHLRFYQGLPQREIADVLGLSQMHISRLLNHILLKLRKQMTR
jgi:RNA polymerase sigma-B factor